MVVMLRPKILDFKAFVLKIATRKGSINIILYILYF